MKSFQVARANLSPYQREDFTLLEKSAVEKFESLRYLPLSECDPQKPTLLITNTHTQLRDLPPELLKNTELIIHPNSGYDHWAQEQSLWKNIPVIIGHTIRAPAVAEYTLGCVFQHILELPQHLTWDRGRRWERKLIRDLKILVYGYGHIGKIVSSTLTSLGAKVSIIDPHVDTPPNPVIELGEADVILLCCSLNTSSEHLINEDFLATLKDDVLIVNGARGKLIDEVALKSFLKFHPRAFAYLDVFEEEPFEDNWRNIPGVWKTSHIAGVSLHLGEKILHFETEVLENFLGLARSDFEKKYAEELLQNKWRKGSLI